jgi:hypothetical protein
MMPMSAQSSLSHCTTTRPGMDGGLERHHGIELPLADHHAAGVLAEVARQVLRHAVELEKFAHARMVEVEAGVAELALGRVVGSLSIPRCATRLLRASSVVIEAQRLAHFARGGAAAIGDDVGGHGGAALSEALVDVLDDALALFAAGQVEIDVGPLAALFGEEALEEQVHADGIDGGDFERVADRAVGGRAAALRQDVVLLGRSARCPRRSGNSRAA